MSAIFDKGIKITNSEDVAAQKVTVQSADGTLGYQSNLTFEKLSTGLLTGGVITINADTTKYNVSATTGLVSNFSNPNLPVFKTVSYAGITGKVSAYLATSNITYIGLDENGILLEQATPFTTSQDRDIISLGAVIHSNRTNINTVNNIGLPTVGASNQLHDLMEAIGALNLSGNKFSANGANLKLNKSAGVLFKLGSNAQNDWKNPHQIAQGATTALTFRYRTQTGAEGLDITDLDPSKYDLSGVLTTVPPNKYTVQTITLFQAGAVRIQYGQNIYNSLDEAEKAIATRSFVAESNIAQNGVNRGYVIMKHNTSSLQNASDAKLIEITKFGGLSSGGLALTFANITAALGYTPEDASNKQNSLATDGTGVKFPTVDAVKSRFDNYTTQRSTISEIRVMSGDLTNNLFYTTDLGQEGNWYYDATDTTSVDNTGTVLVTADGKRIKRVFDYVSFEMFGAKGDGVADDTTAVQNTVAFAGVNKIKINSFGNKKYLIGTISCNSGILIEGNCTFKSKYTSSGFSVSPQPSSDFSVLSIGLGKFPATTGKDVSFISVSDASSFKEGDILFINSNDVYIWDNSMRVAENVVVSGVIGNNIYLTKVLVNSFSSSISFKKLSTDIVSIKGVTFTYETDYLLETRNNIYRNASLIINGAVNPIIHAKFEKDITSGLYLYSCFNPIVDVVVSNLRNNLSKLYYGYGVATYGATRGGLIKVNANGCRHAYTNGSDSSASKNIKDGNVIDVTITGVATNTSSASWDTHPGAISNVFLNCVVLGNSTNSDRPDTDQSFAFQDRGFKTIISNPIISNASAAFAFVGILTNYGEENWVKVIGGESENLNNSIFTGIYTPPQSSTNNYKIYFENHTMTGYSLSLNVQPTNAKVLEISNSTIDLRNIGSISLSNNTLGVSFKNVNFKNLQLFDLGANNSIEIIGCTRINDTSNVQPIRISTASSVYIDRYTAIAQSYNSNHVIRAITGASTLFLGYVSAVNFSPSSVTGNDGVGSFTINNISKTIANNSYLSGTVSLNRLPKSTGTNLVGDSNISDNGTIVSISTEATINGVRVGRGSSSNDSNTVVGISSMVNVSSGIENTSIGKFGLEDDVSGSWNSNLGNGGLRKNTGNANTNAGYNGLGALITGNNNVSFGFESGRYIADGTTPLTNSSSSVFIGHQAKANAQSQSNQIVIGQGAVGGGSNTATIGNTSITKTILRGVISNATVFTVATLPTGVLGDKAVVTDATAPTYLGVLVGGGSVKCPVFHNGTAWVSN